MKYRLESISSNSTVHVLLETQDREEAFQAMSRLHSQARSRGALITKLPVPATGRGVLGLWKHEEKNLGSRKDSRIYRIRQFFSVLG